MENRLKLIKYFLGKKMETSINMRAVQVMCRHKAIGILTLNFDLGPFLGFL